MKILVLDDDPRDYRVSAYMDRFADNFPDATIVYVKTADECLGQMFLTDFDLVLLDHDLNGETFVDSDRCDCGAEVARWWNSGGNKSIGASVVVHSKNVAGANVMTGLISGSVHIPAAWEKEKFETIEFVKSRMRD